MFELLEGEVKALLNQIVESAYFMRGAISYDEMLNRTFVERQVISDFLTKRLEAESGRMSPNY